MGRFWFDTSDPLYSAFVEELEKAYWRGYSVVELARVLAHKNAYNVYRTMRAENILPKLVRQAHKYSLPDVFAGCLRRVGLGFPQWCNSHGIENVRQAAEALKRGVATEFEDEHVFRAYRLDFRNVFDSIFGDTADRYVVYPAPAPSGLIQPTLTIRYIPEQKVYEGCAQSGTTVIATQTGVSAKHVHTMVLKKSVLMMSIAKLSTLGSRDSADGEGERV